MERGKRVELRVRARGGGGGVRGCGERGSESKR